MSYRTVVASRDKAVLLSRQSYRCSINQNRRRPDIQLVCRRQDSWTLTERQLVRHGHNAQTVLRSLSQIGFAGRVPQSVTNVIARICQIHDSQSVVIASGQWSSLSHPWFAGTQFFVCHKTRTRQQKPWTTAKEDNNVHSASLASIGHRQWDNMIVCYKMVPPSSSRRESASGKSSDRYASHRL